LLHLHKGPVVIAEACDDGWQVYLEYFGEMIRPGYLNSLGDIPDSLGIYNNLAACYYYPAAMSERLADYPARFRVGLMGDGTGIDDVTLRAGLGKGLLDVACANKPLPDPLAIILVDLASQGENSESHTFKGILCTCMGVNHEDFSAFWQVS
jgi:hypothetical protein